MNQSRDRRLWWQGVLAAAFFVLPLTAHAQANAASGLVMTPATFSVLNPSIFGDYSAVVLGGSYGQRPVAKTYLFSASLSHVRFQFGHTLWPFPVGGAKSLMTSLDYARGIWARPIGPSIRFVSGVQGSVGYGIINSMNGVGTEGLAAGLIVATGARLSGPGFHLTPYVAPGYFFTREAYVGFDCAQNCDGLTESAFRFSFGGGVRLDLVERLSLEAGVRKTQTANAKTRRSFGLSYRLGDLERDGLRDAGTFKLQMDNDFFARYSRFLDEDYTQGFHFTFNRKKSLGVLSRALSRIQACPAEQKCLAHSSILVGQEIYTPRYYPAVESDDRPFGGWLYGGVQSSAVTDRGITSLSVRVGVTGPPSLAEQLQVSFHAMVPSYVIPPGWDNQLKFEPGLIVTASRKDFSEVRSGLASIGLIKSGSASLGNILTDVEGGLTLRGGLNAPHPWEFNRHRGIGAYASFGVREDVVLHNLFLDGNTFRAGPHVKRVPFVWQKEIGAGLSMGSISLEYQLITRSQEFTTGRRYHPYGTVSLTRRGAF
ncbi:MAG TPA: lipid A deacylase LpxR family protein [Gemmatimonadaceae bacterium]|nr:lipid A deacylase LpxR family protein [Gemmatimonadaceae bacterium]